jgi:hypothetical protein
VKRKKTVCPYYDDLQFLVKTIKARPSIDNNENAESSSGVEDSTPVKEPVSKRKKYSVKVS